MPVATGMTVDSVGFNKQIERFAKMYNLNIGEEMTNQMRLWCGDNIKNFPPALNMQKRAGESKKGVKQRMDIKSDKALGVRAISNDLRMIVQPLSGVEVATTREMGTGVFTGKVRVQSDKGAAWLVDDDLYKRSGNVGSIKAFHERHRKKNGRVNRAGTRNRKVGNWQESRRLHVPERALKKYTKARQKKVGQLKSGWVAGLVRFGGKVPAKWISQGWAAHGSAGGSINSEGIGVLWARNRVRYASEHRRTSDFNFAQRPRLAIKAMKKKQAAMIKAENARRSA